jgi:hypothetical protein
LIRSVGKRPAILGEDETGRSNYSTNAKERSTKCFAS